MRTRITMVSVRRGHELFRNYNGNPMRECEFLEDCITDIRRGCLFLGDYDGDLKRGCDAIFVENYNGNQIMTRESLENYS